MNMIELQKTTAMKSTMEAVAVVDEKMLKGEAAEVELSEKPVDYRYIPHGHGPCHCCGPYSE